MIHVQDGGARQLDRDRFNEAFMMHISTSPLPGLFHHQPTLPEEFTDLRGEVEAVSIDALSGRVAAVMLVPYPPGIPLIMPGAVQLVAQVAQTQALITQRPLRKHRR